MKKIFIVLVVALTFIGCSKPQREVYAEATLLANPDDCALFQVNLNASADEGYASNYDNANDFTPETVGTIIVTPETVGTIIVTPTLSLTKGNNVAYSIYNYNPNFIPGTSAGVFSVDMETEVRVYVDGNLELTQQRTGDNSGVFIVP